MKKRILIGLHSMRRRALLRITDCLDPHTRRKIFHYGFHQRRAGKESEVPPEEQEIYAKAARSGESSIPKGYLESSDQP